MKKFIFLFLSFVLLLSSLDVAAKKQQVSLSRINSNITVDGVMNERTGKMQHVYLLLYQDEPNEKGTPRKNSMPLFTKMALTYMLPMLHKTQTPRKFVHHFVTGIRIWEDDVVILVIDTFNDERSGYEFHVNPLGAQGDIRMTDTDGWSSDTSWNAIWDSAGQINDKGYVVEMRIPF
ncbi:hypothetical protein P4S63_21380 [Pseudoalteromonas sp. B193]